LKWTQSPKSTKISKTATGIYETDITDYALDETSLLQTKKELPYATSSIDKVQKSKSVRGERKHIVCV